MKQPFVEIDDCLCKIGFILKNQKFYQQFYLYIHSSSMIPDDF